MTALQYTSSLLFSDGSSDGQWGSISPNDASTFPSPTSLLEELNPFQLPLQGLEATSPVTPRSSPPASAGEPPEADEALVSVSTVFNPYSCSPQPDLLFISSDDVLFYVHSRRLGKTPSASPAFHRHWKKNGPTVRSNASLLLTTATKQLAPGSLNKLIAIPETSAVLNIILHSLYGSSAAQHSPDFITLAIAVNRMPFYDIKPKDYIIPNAPLYSLLLSHAPFVPVKLYTLAGHHDLYDLAAATSSHLLYFPLGNLSEEIANYMGAVYLQRLLKLHLTRFNALKEILLSPPKLHAPTKYCGFEDQRSLTRAWTLVSSYLAWDARAGTPGVVACFNINYLFHIFCFISSFLSESYNATI